MSNSISVGVHDAGLVRNRAVTSSAMCHGARVDPRRATGTRCWLSAVTSTALRVDGTSAESRSRAKEAPAGASSPVDIRLERSWRRWMRSMASTRRRVGQLTLLLGREALVPRAEDAEQDRRPEPGEEELRGTLVLREQDVGQPEGDRADDTGEQVPEAAVLRARMEGRDEDEEGAGQLVHGEGDPSRSSCEGQDGEGDGVVDPPPAPAGLVECGGDEVEHHHEEQPRQDLEEGLVDDAEEPTQHREGEADLRARIEREEPGSRVHVVSVVGRARHPVVSRDFAGCCVMMDRPV